MLEDLSQDTLTLIESLLRGQALNEYTLFVLSFGAICFGIYLLVKGGDWAVDSAVYVAERAGLSKMFIGATILAFGTSVPELFTSVNANLSGEPGISLGNVIGSNIANILLIIGVTAVVFPLASKRSDVLRDLVLMMIATVVLVALMYTDSIARWQGGVMFGVLVAYVAYQYFFSGGEAFEEPDEPEGIQSNLQAIGLLVLGLILLAAGSELLVQGAVVGGTVLGVPPAVIGLTVIAFGTSLPELSTCLAAAKKGEPNLILGNIIGSNVFNIFSIVGLTAIISNIDVAGSAITDMEIWVMAGVAVAFTAWP